MDSSLDVGTHAQPEQYRRVTAAMVAKYAKVSTATVSLVANGKTAGRVSADIAARVASAIEELGYVVDNAASTLASGAGHFVVFVAPDISNPFYSEVMTGLRASLGADWQLLLSVTENGMSPDVGDIHHLMALRPAGILVHAPSEAFMKGLDRRVPTVLLDAPGADEHAVTVDLDVEDGGIAMAEHLASNGHTTIAYLDAVTSSATFALRKRALMERGESLGLSFVKCSLASTIDLGDAAKVFTEAWPALARHKVSAVVAATDTQAFGVLQGARALGVNIPADLAVAGFDDLPYSAASSPALTSVRFPAAELGHVAGAQLRALMSGQQPSNSKVRLPSRLIARESSLGGEQR